VPPELCSLLSLEKLIINSNQLTELPSEFADMQALRELVRFFSGSHFPLLGT